METVNGSVWICGECKVATLAYNCPDCRESITLEEFRLVTK
jgi:predicted RNA-binding protein with PUA domain